MSKNIVICIDGTGNEFGHSNSNVVKLFSILKQESATQIAYYHPGLGTMGAPNALTKIGRWWTKTIGLAFGYGLSSILTDTYSFLMENYDDGDQIYLFGFSRGAYSCRALAGMLHMFGLLRHGNQALIPYVIRMFKAHERDFDVARQFKDTFSRCCRCHFVGLWDTVSSVGWAYDPLTLPYTAMNPDIEIGRHAISIDERRCAFRQNLWSNKTCEQQDMKQLWFAGVHSDVGGGYPEPESGLAKVTLSWMIDQVADKGLEIDLDRKSLILGKTNENYVKPNPLADMHNSLKGWWVLLEFLPRSYVDMTVNPPKKRWRVPMFSPRFLSSDAAFHPSVIERINLRPDYQPPNIGEELLARLKKDAAEAKGASA